MVARFLFFCFLFSGSFLPMAAQFPVTGLQLWLKPDRGITLRGNEVISWQDQSPGKREVHPLQTPGPSLIEKGIHGFPVLRFDGVDNGLVTTDSLQTFPGKRGTLIVLVKVNGRSKTSGVGLGNLISTFHGKGICWQFGTSGNKIGFYDGKGAEGFMIREEDTPLTGWMIISLCRRNDTLMELYLDGRLDHRFRIDNNQPGLNTLKIGYNGRGGGNNGDSIPEVLNGDLAEILLFDRALSPGELIQTHRYLSEKYQLELRKPPFRETIWFYGMLLMLLFSLAFGISKFISQRRLKKQLEELRREREIDLERQRISREMHDDIGAGLTQIILMSESARHKSPETDVPELDGISATSRKLVNSMSEIIWSLNPENKTLDLLFAYLREQLHRQLEFASMDYRLDLPEGYGHILLNNEQRRNMLLVTKEIVNNAIKYSDASLLIVTAEVNERTLHFSIRDDGKGFDSHQGGHGNGLRNIRHRVEELGGQLQLETAPGKGCLFRYSIPL